MYLKICGIQTFDEALLCYQQGCTALGFLLALTHKAEDKISPEMAREIIKKLPSGVEKVMVTHSLDVIEIAGIANFTGVTSVQIQNDLSEDGITRLRTLLPGRTLIKAIHVEDDRHKVLEQASRMSPWVDRLLLDSRTASRLGGTGKVHDWSISSEVVRKATLPVILAGGLHPGNILQAIQQVNPFGVDVNSGVEDPFGNKDKLKVESFVAQVMEYKGDKNDS